MEIHELLKIYMLEKDMSVTELAKLLGRSRSWISQVVNGHLKPAERLEFKIRKLLEKEGE